MGDLNLNPRQQTVAILAGSRRKEIDYILPVLLRAALHLLEEIPVQFLISVAPTVEPAHVRRIARSILPEELGKNRFRILTLDSKDILANSDFAFVKSGTSALEAALVGIPFLIAYKISPLSWGIGSMLIRTPMKGLVNLIAEEKIVPELYQGEAEPKKLAQMALEYLMNPQKCASMCSQLARIRDRLSVRCASDAAAAAVSSYLRG